MSGDFKSMSELLGDQYAQGDRMGFKSGGHVNTGGIKRGPQKTMDNANIQRKKKLASNERDKEAGDQGPLRPGYKKGGKTRRPRLRGKHVGGPNPEKEYPPSKAEQKMPKGVNKKGGRIKKKAGGAIRKGHMVRSTKHQSSYEDKPHAHMRKGGRGC